jgi:hypothetical protein
LLKRSGNRKLIERRHRLVGWLNAVDGQGGEISEKALKAVDGLSLGGLFGQCLTLGRRGALGGFDNGALRENS